MAIIDINIANFVACFRSNSRISNSPPRTTAFAMGGRRWNRPSSLIAMLIIEACATAHYWARELTKLGHEVRLMPAKDVKAYVKRNKNDAADAEAICEVGAVLLEGPADLECLHQPEPLAKLDGEEPESVRINVVRIVRAEIQLKNPAYIDDGKLPDGRTLSEAHPNGITRESGNALRRSLVKAGYDGAVFRMGPNKEPMQYVAFSPKSVSVLSRDALP
jgi:hypothetical protein